jgi:D-alanyl-D-alanine carboxypeptidase
VTAAMLTDQGSWTGAAGKSGDGRPLVPEAMMGIASISKTFTAAEVLHLVASGRVDLDAPMSRYVKHRLTSNGATVRETLGMRSGIRFHERDLQAMLGAVFAAPGRHWTPQDSLAYQKGKPAAPGGAPAYRDANYWLLGLLVEKVEAPGGDISEVVVDHRSRTGGEGGVDDIDEPSPLPSQRSMVGGGEARVGIGV